MHKTILYACCVLLAAGAAVAQPQLTDDQKLQHATAIDRSVLDEGALYAVLSSAVGWEPAKIAGARIPDYALFDADPRAQRGEYFLIEGAFVAEGKLELARGGTWGKRLTYWVIKFGDINDPRGDNVVVVLMIDPNGTLEAPNVRQPVRIPAMFHKLWRNQVGNSDVDENADFKTFVARVDTLGQVMVGPPVKEEDGGVAGMLKSPYAMILILAVMGIAWFAIRRSLRRMDDRGAYARGYGAYTADDEEGGEVEYRDDLPKDPVEAMAVLQTEHDAAAAEQEKKPKVDPVDALTKLEHEADEDERG